MHITLGYYYILKSTMFIAQEYLTDKANIGLWLSSRNHLKNFGNGTQHFSTVILLDLQAQEVDLALLTSVAHLLCYSFRCFILATE